MSTTIKALALSIFFISTQVTSLKASELKLLSVKEFQQIEATRKIAQEDLSNYEIDNGELISLYKIKSEKKKLLAVKRPNRILIASLK